MRLDAGGRVVVRHGRGDRAVAKRMVAHVDEALAGRPVDQQAVEACTFEVEVRLERPPAGGVNAGDVASVVGPDVVDLVEHVTHAARGGPPAKEAGHHVGVEMPGVRHPGGAIVWNFGDLSVSITTGSRKHA